MDALVRTTGRSRNMSQTILIIEDDKDIAHLVRLHLQDLGYAAHLAHDGATGLAAALDQSFDLIILDLMLPGMSGLEICRQIRAAKAYMPIMMLTAKSSEIDRVLGLELGADDYLVKPFSIQELLARVKAIFRRVEALEARAKSKEPLTLQAGDLIIDIEKRRVTLCHQAVSLTAKEFDLLLQFAQHPGRVYSRSQLLDLVWGLGYEGYEHTVNSHINRLRTKIEADAAKPRYLLTVWGVGYKFADAEDRE